MKPQQKFFQVAFLFAVIVISYLVFSKPNYPQLFSNMDKVGHFGSFFGLAFLTHFAFKLKWLTLVTVLAAYAAFIELVQSRLPYRSASFADFVADMLGVGAFLLCYWLVSRYLRASKIDSTDT